MNIPAALAIKPRTENEFLLLTALRLSEASRSLLENHAFGLHASNFLHTAHNKRLKQQLAAEAEKIKKKAKADWSKALARFEIAHAEWEEKHRTWKEEYNAARKYNRAGKAAYDAKVAAAKESKQTIKKSANIFTPKVVPERPAEPRLEDFLEGSQMANDV